MERKQEKHLQNDKKSRERKEKRKKESKENGGRDSSKKKKDDISVEHMFPFCTLHFLVVSKHWVLLIKLRDPLHNANQSFLLSIAKRWMASVPI